MDEKEDRTEMETSCKTSQSLACSHLCQKATPAHPRSVRHLLYAPLYAFCSPNTILIMPDGNLIFLLTINRLLAVGSMSMIPLNSSSQY